MKRTCLLIFLILLASSQQLYAIKVSGLYESTVPMKNESVSLRKAGIKQALTSVLIKLTGDRAVVSNSNIVEILKQPDRFVQQFRYKENDSKTFDNDESAPLLLQVKFDETLLNQVVRDYGLTLWGNERPAVLVWLVEDDGNGRRIISFEEQPEYLGAVDSQAIDRGLTLLFPLLDLQDSAGINASDLWGGFQQPIIDASERYQSDAILVGKIQQPVSGKWQIEWTLLENNQTQGWQSGGQTAGEGLAQGIDELVDRIATEYTSFASTRAELITVEVANINSLDDYAKTLSYLESLQTVTSVIVKKIMPERVIFEVIIHGGSDVLNQAVSLSNLLEVVNGTQLSSYRLVNQ